MVPPKVSVMRYKLEHKVCEGLRKGIAVRKDLTCPRIAAIFLQDISL